MGNVIHNEWQKSDETPENWRKMRTKLAKRKPLRSPKDNQKAKIGQRTEEKKANNGPRK